MRRPWSEDEVERPPLSVVPSWVLHNSYCSVCAEGMAPDMALVLGEDGLWRCSRCAEELST